MLAALLFLMAGFAPRSMAQAAPPNDNFANAIVIPGTNTVVTGSNVNATKQPGEPDIAGNPGGKSVWWYWQAPATPGLVTISTEGSIDTYDYPLVSLLGVFTGDSLLGLTEITTNAFGLPDGGAIVSFPSSPGTTYWIAVDGYTWGTAQDADSGSIVLTLTLTALPSNDNFSNAIAILGTNAVVTGSNIGATKEPGEPDIADNPGGKSVWWYWQAPARGCVTLSTEGSTDTYGDPLESLLGVFTGVSVSNLTDIATNQGGLFDGGSIVSFQCSPETVYWIAVDGETWDTAQDADSGSITLTLTFTTNSAANDDFANASAIVGNNAVVTGSNIYATKEPGEPFHAGNLGGKSVWWYWRAAQTGSVTLSTDGSASTNGGPLNSLIGVYTGSSVANLVQVSCNNVGNPTFSFKAIAGTTYRIAVDGFTFDTEQDADSGSIVLSLAFTTNIPYAPGWSLPAIDGTTVSSTNFAGDVIVLNFWATWCGPCVGEIPTLIALQQKYGPDGLQVIGASVDDSTDNINPPINLVGSFAENNGMNYPVVMTRPLGYTTESDFGGIYYIPESYIIDRQNHIVQTFVGAQSFATFENAVVPLLYPNLKVSLAMANGQAHLSWPANQAAFVIETTDNLGSGVWTISNAGVQSDGVNQYIDLPVGPSSQFYRLIFQP
ncbi:MAG TPA: TlpA disulfide reductase family protein [Verrucomicrobiae bacterium]|nr:TlpA disulfide reductase family protein [Verrucomicrobiae bacterium]